MTAHSTSVSLAPVSFVCCLRVLCMAGLFCGFAVSGRAQTAPLTGTQQMAFTGLRAQAYTGQVNAVVSDGQGNLILLLNQGDGVRLLKTDATATNVLAQALLGAKGDLGLAMALDPSGNVYVTGTTTSGALRGTAGAAFPAVADSSTNSFVAKFDTNLNAVFVTLCGGGRMAATAIAATADAAFVTGNIFAATLPVTPSGIIQAPAFGSTQNGFVEKFSAAGTSLLYATYLSGANGNTSPTAIAADSADNAYIAGNTTSTGYPTIAAVVPSILTTAETGAASGFLTRLTPTGNGITFSTYIPGAGITSIALDAVAGNLLLAGSISLGQFPVASVAGPVAYGQSQALLRMSLDGKTVVGSTLLAPGTQSFVTAGLGGAAWVAGAMSLPALPLTALSTLGTAFLVRVNAQNSVDQTARFGGLATTNPGNAGAPVTLNGIATDASGQPIVGGVFSPTADASLLATETFDLALSNAPSNALPAAVRAAVLPASACAGSLCPGSAAFLAKLATPATAGAALALAVDDSPNLTLRNLGSTQAVNVTIAVTGFTENDNCAGVISAGGECSIALRGVGPGSITVKAANAATQTQSLPALAAGSSAVAVVFSPKELDFGVVSSGSGTVTSGPSTRTITVTNLGTQSQTFISAPSSGTHTTLPYTFAEVSSDCAIAGASTNKVLAPGGTCHITLGLTASSSAADDGLIQANWTIGARAVQMTAYGQAAALSVSAAEVDFGTQYTNGLKLPRYLYLSNSSNRALGHQTVTVPPSSPFAVTDGCPALLEPYSVCQMRLGYQGLTATAADAVTLTLDQGLTVLVTGKSLPQPSANGASVNPNLSLSASTLNFATPVVVTGTSSGTQTLTVSNTGASAFALAIAVTGDFTNTTNCGTSLAGGASCSLVFSFTPSQPGTRQGLVTLTAGAGTTPAFVTLTGVGTGILTPANNGTLDFGSILVGQPVVHWFKITQPFTSFTASVGFAGVGTPYGATLVEDVGYGHGSPATTAFTTTAKGTCLNCWLGVQFTPSATGMESGTLTLSSVAGGSGYVLALTGTGLPLAGLLLTPVAQDFGPVPLGSASAAALFTLTNEVVGGAAVTVGAPGLTGDFAVSQAMSGGATCGGALAYAASCFIQVAFAPTMLGDRVGSLTLQAGTNIATAALTGYGEANPGISLSPAALVFGNVPGSSATTQSVVVGNASGAAVTIGAPSVSASSPGGGSFAATTNCNALAEGGICTITVNFTAGSAQATGTLTIPVTSTTGGNVVVTSYTVPLTGAYTTEDAGLQILPGEAQYGPQATEAAGVTRQFTINNLTAESLALSIALPRQFVLSGAPCSGLAPNASCAFSVTFLPLANGDITGTLFAQATPADGTATLNGIGYVEGYGIGAGALSVTGGLLPGRLLSFGQAPSGGSVTKVVTITNTGLSPMTVRRITTEWPFLSTSTCGATLAVGKACAVTLTYTPINQVALGASAPPTNADVGTLVIESDAASSPDFIDLAGTSTPAYVGSPSNIGPLNSLVASQSSLTFATTQVGDLSAPQTVTLANTGTATLHILGTPTTADFTVAGNCSGALVPAASCTLVVTFTPQSAFTAQTGNATTRIGAVEIASDASTSLEFISLLGTASPPTLTLAQNTMNFGTVLVGANASLPATMTNTGTVPVTFSGFGSTGDYTASGGSCGASLAASTSCSLQVVFAPVVTGTRTGTLSVSSSSSTLPLTVALTGVGAQSHLQISPSSLNFGSLAVGAAASLSLTLANTGTASVTGVALAISGDYAVTVPCALTTLAAGASCSVTVTFTPSAIGSRNGTLTVTSSDASSPGVVPLTGTAISNGTFTLTLGGAASASGTVTSGFPATYTMTVTPVNGFSGTVVLNCTPVVSAVYASCSLLPSSLTLSGAAQNSVATITTVTSMAAAKLPPGQDRSFRDTALGLLLPAFIFSWKARRSRHRAWRKAGPMAWAFLCSAALLSSGGCGSSTPATPLRYAAPGAYQYQVTASSVSGTTVPQITQTVTLNLVVQ